MSDITQSVHRSAERYGLRGARVAIAVSGGGDSVALFWLLVRLRTVLALRIHLIHVDHGWRADGQREAGFCQDLARRAGVGSSVVRLGRPVRRSEEEARVMRHGALRHVATSLGADAVALAHQLDDQAETALMQTLRGSASPIGMAEWSAPMWRPLLGTTRSELRELLAELGEAHVDDPTNASGAFLRNRVRHELLPRMRAENPQVAAALARLAEFSRADDDELSSQALKALGDCPRVPGGILIAPRTGTLPLPVLRRVLREIMRARGAEVDSHGVAIGSEALVSGGRMQLRKGLWVESGGVWWGESPPPSVSVPPAGRIRYGRVFVGVGEPPPGALARGVPAEGTLAVRARLPGDRIALSAGHRKIQDVLVDHKVPRPLRDHLPVVTLDGEPIWLPGAPAAPSEPQPEQGRIVWVDPGSVVSALWCVVK